MDSDLVTLENDSLRLQVARSFGPRIVSLNYKGGANLLAELPDFVTRRPDGKIYRLYGGHRLWVAPEDHIRSYALDDRAVDIADTADGLLIRKPVEPETGIEKSMLISLAKGEAKLTITHRLTNRGPAAVECAPWAITQVRKGGVAILPQAITQTGLLPNRTVAFWPYSDITSPHLKWGNRHLLVHAQPQPIFKIGFPNPRGWLAYWLEGTLFFKCSAYDARAEYFDLGCSSECFCNDQFLELETLAPKVNLAPGASTAHVETWGLRGEVDFPKDEDALTAMMDAAGLK